ncbi:Putative N-acetylmannosamine-6-phosphate 2-epimerase [Halomicronema hongdechloris C2206]|uniref:Putative N-acetylmannosamine-6-phosphate 2-epimerase n=1 Tax=Halomicronema hongdechloris C2206 TaxID=1641165 RepID=A0A1Z3HSB0_9CYAN|nr:N-acetylmannosamine-6-phosphate 2-epimerase [Halomicronema hongdechloris]ASC73156.1 Putative N-acetylmannosamine-6-phosphate 2-epimerase [Halomicronema hongdechloris C2206]
MAAANDVLAALRRGLIVSCQAPPFSPLHHPEVIAAMAEAAVNQAAAGVRIDSPAHIRAVRARIEAPIIGLWKRTMPGIEVYITPQFHHAIAVAEAGADIIAIDATQRPRHGPDTVSGLIRRIHEELQRPVMADVDTLEAAIAASRAGADLIGTTLSGYTDATRHLTPPNFTLLSHLVEQLSVPILCEGGLASPEMARRAINLGAYAVVVGTAITGIDSLVQRYVARLASP